MADVGQILEPAAHFTLPPGLMGEVGGGKQRGIGYRQQMAHHWRKACHIAVETGALLPFLQTSLNRLGIGCHGYGPPVPPVLKQLARRYVMMKTMVVVLVVMVATETILFNFFPLVHH